MSDKQRNEKTASQAAVHLGYSLKYFYEIAHKIPHRRWRRLMYFKVEDLDKFLESQSVEHTPETAS